MNSVLIAYVHLLSEMIDNEIQLISRFLNSNDGEISIFKQVFGALIRWSPVQNIKSILMNSKDHFKIVFKFLGRIAITESGCGAVLLNGPEILKVML